MQPALPTAPESRVPGWDLLALLGFAALAGLAFLLWPDLPDPLPTHWGLRGRPDGWTSKAVVPWLMFGLPLFVWLLLVVVGRFAVPKDAVLGRLQRDAMAPLRGCLVLGLCELQSGILLVPVLGPGVFKGLLLGFLGLLVLGIALMARRVQRGLPPEHRARYKWGLFYANAYDPRLLVPKLLGIGWTFNYARPAAWWITGLLLALPLAAVAFTVFAASSR
ncbi:MAG: DUF1648 domain-containing protein [Holophagaceae bacterium]|nr:DUF1648 domain-containing protein [Holophagaceae bacterium]